jgi:HAD superfamily hydrolase (TIGR01544 family)
MPDIYFSSSSFVFITFASLFTISASLRMSRRRRTLIRDPIDFARKRASVISAGICGTHFVVDFDRTLTTYLVKNGARGDSCHGIIEKRPGIAEKAAALNTYYYAIETNPLISKEAKTPFMIEWYDAVNEMLSSSGITRQDIASDVTSARLELRYGMRTLLNAARDVSLPVTIFSAGIGDVIMEVLMQRWAGHEPMSLTPLPRSLRVVSNWMTWLNGNPEANCIGWSSPLIHMFNKHATSLKSHDFIELAQRKAVVLVGDSEGDITMADGLEAEIVLKIGFLNIAATAPPHLIDHYSQIYDIVFLDDAPAWEVEDIIRELLNGHG